MVSVCFWFSVLFLSLYIYIYIYIYIYTRGAGENGSIIIVHVETIYLTCGKYSGSEIQRKTGLVALLCMIMLCWHMYTPVHYCSRLAVMGYGYQRT